MNGPREPSERPLPARERVRRAWNTAWARLRDGGTPHPRITLGLGAATLLVGAWLALRSSGPASAPEPEAILEGSPTDLVASTTPDLPPLPDAPLGSQLPGDCATLAARAREGGPDAVLLAWLCRDWPLDAVAARAALLAVRSPDEAAALVPRLVDHPALQGLLQLVAQAPAAAVSTLPDPSIAVVSPIDDEVLAQVQRAHAIIAARGISHTERTRARAFVAKTYLQATQQLGVGVGRPPEPFARLLAGRALYYGRSLCTTYLRHRVSGLAPLFQEIETRLLAMVIALEASPHLGDAARLAVELDETRRYLQREGPRDRIARRSTALSRAAQTSAELSPLPNDLDRLLDHGFVDLALTRAIAEATRPDGPGLLPMEQQLRDSLARAERGEYVALLEHRLERARARTPAPPERGANPPARGRADPWTAASPVADEAAAWIERAPAAPDFPRRYALGRALLLVRSRPDALMLLLDHATAPDASLPLRQSIGWLTQELVAWDDGRLAWLQRRVATDESMDLERDQDALEAARRRRLALGVRDDGRLPRGPGMTDR